MKKILYVATVVKTHIMEFHIPYLKMLKEDGWETAVAARNDYENPKDCVIPYCDKYFDIAFERNPLHPQNIIAYKQLKKVIDKEKYDIIHCHTPVGGVLGRLAALSARKEGTKVIYTAHGFHFYKGAPLLNWLLYYPVESILAHCTDALIAINQEDYKQAQKFKARKTYYVAGVGIDTKKFYPKMLSLTEREKLRVSLGVLPGDKMLLSVGELTPRKNHEAAILAVAELTNYPIKYFICGCGKLKAHLLRVIQEQKAESFIKLLGYREDISNLLECTDLFIFPSKQEGLPVALMEAIASKTAVLCSNIRGNRELVEANSLFELNDTLGLKKGLEEKLVSNNRINIESNYETLKKFDLTLVIEKVKKIYESE